MGPVHRGRLVYTSVIVFGSLRILDERSMKVWFFDRVLEKYGQPDCFSRIASLKMRRSSASCRR